eukprot:5168759-Pleurochrysis_carterae.AAC.1
MSAARGRVEGRERGIEGRREERREEGRESERGGGRESAHEKGRRKESSAAPRPPFPNQPSPRCHRPMRAASPVNRSVVDGGGSGAERGCRASACAWRVRGGRRERPRRPVASAKGARQRLANRRLAAAVHALAAAQLAPAHARTRPRAATRVRGREQGTSHGEETRAADAHEATAALRLYATFAPRLTEGALFQVCRMHRQAHSRAARLPQHMHQTTRKMSRHAIFSQTHTGRHFWSAEWQPLMARSKTATSKNQLSGQ